MAIQKTLYDLSVGGRRGPMTIHRPGQVETTPTPDQADVNTVLYVLEMIRRQQTACAEKADGIDPNARQLVDMFNDLVNPKATPLNTVNACGGCQVTTSDEPNKAAQLFDAMLCYYQRSCADLPQVPTSTAPTVESRIDALEAGQATISAQLAVLIAGQNSQNPEPDVNGTGDVV